MLGGEDALFWGDKLEAEKLLSKHLAFLRYTMPNGKQMTDYFRPDNYKEIRTFPDDLLYWLAYVLSEESEIQFVGAANEAHVDQMIDEFEQTGKIRLMSATRRVFDVFAPMGVFKLKSEKYLYKF